MVTHCRVVGGVSCMKGVRAEELGDLVMFHTRALLRYTHESYSLRTREPDDVPSTPATTSSSHAKTADPSPTS